MSYGIRAEKKKSSKPPFLIMSLPEDVISDILAHLPRWDYPILSLVSKHFRSLVTSPDLYIRRSLLGCTEHYLYVFLYNKQTYDKRWYTLLRDDNIARLVPIPSLPAMPHNASYVTVGYKIYVFCPWYDNERTSSLRALSIDCISHTVQSLPDMPILMDNTRAGVIDGKIYAIGVNGFMNKVVVVFDTETQMWETEMIKPPDRDIGLTGHGCVVMADKLYAGNIRNSYIYGPKESKWTTEEMLNTKDWWWKNPCVIDDVLYYYDFFVSGSELRAYDPKQRCWEVVKGTQQSLLIDTSNLEWWDTVNYGGKLALLYKPSRGKSHVLLAEIALERRREGKFWGKED